MSKKFKVPMFDLSVKDEILMDKLTKAFRFTLSHGMVMLGPEVEELEKEEDESNTIDIDELLAKIEQLELLASSLEEKKEESLKYKRVVIDFKKKTKLDILSMKSPEFKRNLMGTMYFKVLDINEDEKYMILKTSGYSRIDESLFFKLEYKGLETYKDQKGDINLIYSRHRNPSINPVEGEIEDCYYRIIQLK